MPFNGSGGYNRPNGPTGWQADAAANIKIKSDLHDNHDQDIANALSNTICKDGQSQIVADISLGGFKITNLSNGPYANTDAVNRAYVDAAKTYSTGITISGADLNGRITFSSGTGVNGLSWTGADLSWLARLVETDKTSNRLVLNNTAAGTSTDGSGDVVTIDETGRINSSGYLTNNLSWDGGKWRTIAPGFGTLINYAGGIFKLQSNDTATITYPYVDVSTAGATALRDFFTVQNSAGQATINLNKSASGKLCRITGQMAGKNRWSIDLGNATGESSTRTGSDFYLYNWANDGTTAVASMSVARATNAVNFPGAISGGSTISAEGGSMVFGDGGAGRIMQFAPSWFWDWASASGALHYQGPGQTFLSMIPGNGIFSSFGNLTINGATAIKAVSGVWGAPSDARLKIIGDAYTRGLAEIRALPAPRRFAFKKDPDVQHVSYIAQDVEAVFPECVTRTEGEVDGGTVNDLRQLDPTNLLWAAMNAIRELGDKLEAAEARIAALEAA